MGVFGSFMRKKRVGFGLGNFLFPLLVLPFGFFGIYCFENGLSFVTAIMAIVLLFVLTPVIVLLWSRS